MSIKELFSRIADREGNGTMVSRYISFIESRPGVYIKNNTQLHHILPKAKDFFPEYSNLSQYVWNGIHLTHREHFIAHWMLARAFPKSSQAIAFFHITNIQGKARSKEYVLARQHHIENVKEMTQRPSRNAKISAALKGKPKSESHKLKLKGHAVSEETREKLRLANIGKKWSDDAKASMSKARTGMKKKPNSPEAIERMIKTKLAKGMRWCNNGVIQKLTSSLPEGWVYGKISSPTSGRKHYNNGVISKMFVTPPDDSWVIGRLRKKN